MKRNTLIAICLMMLGFCACQKDTQEGVVSHNARTAGVTNNNPGTQESLEQAYWKVGLFIDAGKDLTVNYQNYVFHFGSENVLTITDITGRQVITGFWQLTGTGSSASLIIDIESLVANELTLLNGIWTVLTFNVNSMIDLTMNNGAKRLRFHRI